jgi:hypothetical protein
VAGLDVAAAGCWQLAAPGCWMLAAGCWRLVAAGCCWLLAAAGGCSVARSAQWLYGAVAVAAGGTWHHWHYWRLLPPPAPAPASCPSSSSSSSWVLDHWIRPPPPPPASSRLRRGPRPRARPLAGSSLLALASRLSGRRLSSQPGAGAGAGAGRTAPAPPGCTKKTEWPREREPPLGRGAAGTSISAAWLREAPLFRVRNSNTWHPGPPGSLGSGVFAGGGRPPTPCEMPAGFDQEPELHARPLQ